MFIKEVSTGETHRVRIVRVKKNELKGIKKKDGWKFNWNTEDEYEAYKLVLHENAQKVLGLISLMNGVDGDYIEIRLLESAPENIGSNKKYDFVAGVLIAHACQVSFERENEGWVAFESKTDLKKHYANMYGAKDTGMRCMYFDTPQAYKLIRKYLYPEK